jgi:uncharacterized protein YqgC (DUF456 family)
MVLVGLAGIVVPVLPGLVLVWGGVAAWALSRHDAAGWAVLAVATTVAALGTVAKYLLPGRRLRESGVPWTTIAAGTLLGIVGFFLVPLVGVALGFVLGVYLAEVLRLRDRATAWSSSRRALLAVGWSILIELTAAMLITATWLIGLVATA